MHPKIHDVGGVVFRADDAHGQVNPHEQHRGHERKSHRGPVGDVVGCLTSRQLEGEPRAEQERARYGWLPYEYIWRGLALDWWSFIGWGETSLDLERLF
jgi:hypothetical protein